MFKKPFEVKLDAQTVQVDHNIHVTAKTLYNTNVLIEEAGKTAMRVIATAAVAGAASQILVHIVKTKIK